MERKGGPEPSATGLDSSSKTEAVPAEDGSSIVQTAKPTDFDRISVDRKTSDLVRPVKLVEKAEPLNHGATNRKLVDTTEGNASAAYDSPVEEVAEETQESCSSER